MFVNPISGRPSYEQLAAENARLREQLAQNERGIHLDLEKEQIAVHDLRSPGLEVEEVRLHVPGLARLSQPLLKPEAYVDGKVPLPDLSAIAKMPMKVQTARLSLSEESVNEVLSKVAVEGMSDMRLKIDTGGQIRLSGQAHKAFFSIPFELKGKVSREDRQSLRFQLESTKVAGFLPVPRLMTNLFAALASQELAQAQIRREDGDFIVSLKERLPEQLQMGLERVTTQDGKLYLEAGPHS